FLAAFAVVACALAYAVYLRLGHLKRRVSPRKLIVLTLPAAPKLHWGAINVILYWILFFDILTLIITGVLLYVGWGGTTVTVHYTAAIVVVGYIPLHVASHLSYGGINQLLRLFRAQKLRLRRGAVAWPFAIAAVVGIAVASGFYATDIGTRDVLKIARTTEP